MPQPPQPPPSFTHLRHDRWARFLVLSSALVILLMFSAAPVQSSNQKVSGTLSAESVSGAYRIHLQWPSQPLLPLTEIQRSLDGVHAWETIALVSDNQYDDTAVACSHRYAYRLRGWDAENIPADWTPPQMAQAAPCAPVQIRIYPVPGWYILDVSWDDIASDESALHIERTRPGGDWSHIATLAPNTNYFADRFHAHECSRSWSYRVRSERDGLFSPYSEIVTDALPPCAPTSVWVALAAEPAQVQIHWRDASPDETGFEIWRRSADQQQFHFLSQIAAADGQGEWLVWADGAPVCEQRNAYAVRSLRGTDVYSPWSTAASITAPDCPQSSPTPTASPTATPSPTASATFTPTPSPSPSATPAPTHTLTATPTLDPTHTPTATAAIWRLYLPLITIL